jgi:hypothetical protein
VLSLSQSERDRLVVLYQVRQKQLSVSEGARRCRVGLRHFRRLLRRFEGEGDAVVVHALRGRPSNRCLARALREQTLVIAHDPLYADFGPTLLSEHLARDHALAVPAWTLRRWMLEAGLWTATPQRVRHRRRRERRAAFGELLLMDTSIHDWLEGRGGTSMVLIALIDDATSRIFARFFPRDTGAANRQLIVDYLGRFGRPGALYTDRAGHFQAHFRARERRAKDQEEALTLIRRGLDALEIELILALSPQAKGRVERLFGTLQDRLIKEMRVAGIASMDGANRFLEEVFVPFWEKRFTVAAREGADAHRPLPEGCDLLRQFAETCERSIRPDFTFRYKNVFYQIEAAEADDAMPGRRLTLEHRLDGTTCYRWEDGHLHPTPLPEAPRRAASDEKAPPKPRPLSGAAGKPIPPTHPWRRAQDRDVARALARKSNRYQPATPGT